MKTALVTLGRLPKGLDICRALARDGWRVIVAEPAKRHLCGLSNCVAKSVVVTAPNLDHQAYLNEILAVVVAEDVSLIVPVSEEIMHASLLKPMLPEGVRMACEPHEKLLPLHDKYRFQQLALSFGLAVPETHLLSTPQAQELAQRSDVFIKPALTCSGQGLAFVPKGSALPQVNAGQDVLVQTSLTGVHSSSFSIAHEGRVIGTVVYKPEIVSGTVSVAFRQSPDANQQREFVELFVSKTAFSGLISFDFIEDGNGIPHAIECNPRATSGIHFVEQQSLADAIVNPETCSTLRLKSDPVMYQLWPVLTETQGSMFRPGKGYFHKMGTMLRQKEANFEWSDPKPVWFQPYAAWEILKRSTAMKQSFGEAATHDIAWFGEAMKS